MENSLHLLGKTHRSGSINWTRLTLKQTAVILLCFLLCFVAVVFCFLAIVFPSNKPPREGKLIENFNAHRAAYERLRDMLQADDQLLRVASWGVETTKSGINVPPEGDFPIGRYNEYLALLRETGGIGAFRGRGARPDSVSIGVWASGWAADTRHVHICWVDQEPANQVASLEDYYQTPKPRHPVFRHIDGNWYLWADW
jgi:hypothetical protein